MDDFSFLFISMYVNQIKMLSFFVSDEDAEEEELSADNLKMQLDLQEQEMSVLRRKLDDMQKENENLQSEVKYLQEKILNQPLIEVGKSIYS